MSATMLNTSSPAQINTGSNTDRKGFSYNNLIAGFSNEVFFLFLVMIALFFVNLYYVLKNHILNTFYNILKRTFVRMMKSDLNFIKKMDIKIMDNENEKLSTENLIKLQAHQCTICLNPIKFEANATNCIIEYWISQNKYKMKCPNCRRPINYLYFNENNSGLENKNNNFEENKNIVHTIKHLYEYNYHFSKDNRDIDQIICDFPFLIRRTLSFLASKEGLKFLLNMLESNFYLFLLIAYVLSPFDLIPECIFGLIGLIDDLLILCLIFIILTNYYYEFIKARDNKRYKNFLDY